MTQWTMTTAFLDFLEPCPAGERVFFIDDYRRLMHGIPSIWW